MLRVMLKFEIDCDADAAWHAIHSPAAVAEVYGPLMQMEPLEPLPPHWESGANATVRLLAAGLLSTGTQMMHLTDSERELHGTKVRILRDTGIPLTGPLAMLDVWDHQMAASEVSGQPGKTLWRDRLVIGGAAAPLLWPVLWSTWQWRQQRIRALAPTWAHDV